MIIVINPDNSGVDLGIKFTHNFTHGEVEEKRSTVCEIVQAPTGIRIVDGVGRVIAKGVARVHENDNYDRVAGRLVAFKRAIKDLPRPIRKELGDAYRSKCRIKALPK